MLQYMSEISPLKTKHFFLKLLEVLPDDVLELVAGSLYRNRPQVMDVTPQSFPPLSWGNMLVSSGHL